MDYFHTIALSKHVKLPQCVWIKVFLSSLYSGRSEESGPVTFQPPPIRFKTGSTRTPAPNEQHPLQVPVGVRSQKHITHPETRSAARAPADGNVLPHRLPSNPSGKLTPGPLSGLRGPASQPRPDVCQPEPRIPPRSRMRYCTAPTRDLH